MADAQATGTSVQGEAADGAAVTGNPLLLGASDGANVKRIVTTTAVEGTGDNVALTGVLAVGVGPGFDRRDNPANLATAVNSTTTFDTNGSMGAIVGINTSTSGTFTFEVTADNTTWIAADVFDEVTNQITSGNYTPAVGSVYRVGTAGFRQLRTRTVTTLGATMAHFYTGYQTAKTARQTTAGDLTHDSVDAGNPMKVGFQARSSLPTAVSNADRSNAVSDLWGRQMVTHIDPAQQVHKAFNATTTQAGTDVWTPTSGKKIAVTSVVIGSYGTTSGRLILWFGDNADTTYTAGTDQVLVAASFAPSATVKPGLVFTPAVPVFCTTADRELHCTTDAGLSIDVTVEGYEW